MADLSARARRHVPSWAVLIIAAAAQFMVILDSTHPCANTDSSRGAGSWWHSHWQPRALPSRRWHSACLPSLQK